MEVLDSESDQMSLFLRHQIFTRGDLLEQMPYPLSIFQLTKYFIRYLNLLLSKWRKLPFTM
jgi:hypothetical protein